MGDSKELYEYEVWMLVHKISYDVNVDDAVAVHDALLSAILNKGPGERPRFCQAAMRVFNHVSTLLQNFSEPAREAALSTQLSRSSCTTDTASIASSSRDFEDAEIAEMVPSVLPPPPARPVAVASASSTSSSCSPSHASSLTAQSSSLWSISTLSPRPTPSPTMSVSTPSTQALSPFTYPSGSCELPL